MLISSSSFAAGPKWVFKSKSAVENNPNLRHHVWEMERPPNGPFDKIALHRVVYKGTDPQLGPDKRKVIFIIPGTWSTTNLFLANNGYDVFTMDFRTAYVPNLAYDQFGPEVASTATWTYGVYREDIKACVDEAKRITGAKKIFLGGRSRGGTQMFIYASKYWQEDLKGLIGLDGGGVWANTPNPDPMTYEEYLGMMAAFQAGFLGPLLYEIDDYEQMMYAGAVPESINMVGETSVADYALTLPPTPDGSAIETVSDVIAFGAYYAWGVGGVTNYYTPYPGGEGETYMDLKTLIGVMSNFTRYWPHVQNLEGVATGDYVDCPYLDYDDHLAEITLPIIYFGGELGCAGGWCQYVPPNKTASTDVTVVYLPGYGHLDVYAGTHSLETVKQPLLEWMNERL
jgi:pimeloyl-ACP methyl ester carboxylesterase